MGTGTMTGWGRGFCGEQQGSGAARGGRGVWQPGVNFYFSGELTY